MTKYTATFADGTTITRKSSHAYTVAWRATWTDDNGCKRAPTGFAVTRERANPVRPSTSWAVRHLSPAKRAENRKADEAFIVRSGYAVEFVNAVAEV